jgi:hypothetical protein
MTQSMIGVVVALAVMIVIAAVMGRRYRRDHPEEPVVSIRTREWLDSHHMGWFHHRH